MIISTNELIIQGIFLWIHSLISVMLKKPVIHSTSASLGYIETVNVGIHLNHPYSWMKNSILHKYTIFWFSIILIIIQWKKNQKLKTQILQYVSYMPECLTKGINKICPNSYFFNFFLVHLLETVILVHIIFILRRGGGAFQEIPSYKTYCTIYH